MDLRRAHIGAGLCLSLLLGAWPATAATAKQPLSEVSRIDDQMLWVGLAIEIGERCETLGPRTLKGLGFLWDLRDEARKLGYTDDEIRAYVRSDAEKARIRGRGEDYVRSQGLDPALDADLCKLGAMEMEKGSQIGAFLKEK